MLLEILACRKVMVAHFCYFLSTGVTVDIMSRKIVLLCLLLSRNTLLSTWFVKGFCTVAVK